VIDSVESFNVSASTVELFTWYIVKFKSCEPTMDACFVNEIGVTTVSQKFRDLDENITGMCLFSK
jgi:hypothetical protein